MRPYRRGLFKKAAAKTVTLDLDTAVSCLTALRTHGQPHLRDNHLLSADMTVHAAGQCAQNAAGMPGELPEHSLNAEACRPGLKRATPSESRRRRASRDSVAMARMPLQKLRGMARQKETTLRVVADASCIILPSKSSPANIVCRRSKSKLHLCTQAHVLLLYLL